MFSKKEVQWVPCYGGTYYVPRPDYKSMYGASKWYDMRTDRTKLERGLVFRTSGEAVKCAKRMMEVV